MGAWGVSLSKLNAGSLNRRGDVGLAGRGDVGLAGRGDVGLAGRGDVALAGRGDVGLAGRGDVGLASEMCDELGLVVVRSDAWHTDVYIIYAGGNTSNLARIIQVRSFVFLSHSVFTLSFGIRPSHFWSS